MQHTAATRTTKLKDMKFTLYVNQRAIVENGLPIDVTDALIFYALIEFINNPKFKKVAANGKEYTFVSWVKIVEHLPVLGITTKPGIIKRVNKLIALQLIERSIFHNETYYAAGTNAGLLSVESKQMDTPSVNERLHRRKQMDTPSVNERLHNNTINDKNINKSEKEKKTHAGVNDKVLEFYRTESGQTKIRNFAAAELLTVLPDAVQKQTALKYSYKQYQAYIAATLAGIVSIDLTKCEFTDAGEIVKTDLTQHVLNIALKQCRTGGGLILPTMPPEPKQQNKHPFASI
ncbi:class I SAM-dependent DNA methyltransferase [Sphingobacteriales bacterium UPWRP_1]|nr:hypothetical protein BVG80_03405 [Sphingobacteriales bacterium TSM_CSM]PSJ75612.1 class I SAM-dependent DNA methyltransferase [Sphingobacteriales bacterium UPWRP_1]